MFTKVKFGNRAIVFFSLLVLLGITTLFLTVYAVNAQNVAESNLEGIASEVGLDNSFESNSQQNLQSEIAAEEFKSFNYVGSEYSSQYDVPLNLDDPFNASFSREVQNSVGLDSEDDQIVNQIDFSITRKGSDGYGVAQPLGDGGVYYVDEAGENITVSGQKEDGSFIILEIIGSSASPTSFQYDLSLPNGYYLEHGANGTVDIIDARGEDTNFGFAPSWAVDSSVERRSVPTSYSIVGTNTLILNVDHTSGDFTYPIIADPCGDDDENCTGATVTGIALGCAGLGFAFGGLGGALAGAALCGIGCWLRWLC